MKEEDISDRWGDSVPQRCQGIINKIVRNKVSEGSRDGLNQRWDFFTSPAKDSLPL